MMRRLSTRAWVVLMIALGLVATASGAGLVLSLHAGSRAQPAAAAATPGPQPGSAQAPADLARMQSLLNSGSASKQAALLVPPFKFAPGGSSIVPAGKTITIRPGTFHASGRFATVQASVSDGTTVTLGLYSVQGHWHLYDVRAGAQTSVKVTSRPGAVSAQLMSDVTQPKYVAPNQVPTWQEIGTKVPVILVHGLGETASTWSDGANNMLDSIGSVSGVMPLRFDYAGTDREWVDDPSNGPALAQYIHAVAQASKEGKGSGKVVLAGFSMGGLMIRYAATTGAVAGDIAMVITIATPNTGTMIGNAAETLRAIACSEQSLTGNPGSDFCLQWGALDGLSAFGPGIRALGKLPPSIPVLHAIAGDETYITMLWVAKITLPLFGDGIVPTWSALDKRTGWMHDTFDTVRNPPVVDDVSVWHLALKRNLDVIRLMHGYISAYAQANYQSPAVAAPILGGDAYWLAGGGRWWVHDSMLQISRGPSGLVGDENWNAGGTIITGHAQIAFTSNADGSLTGTFTTSTTYTYSQQPLPAGFLTPGPMDGPQKGQTFTLVPVAPMLAKSIPGSGGASVGNPYLCQAGLAPSLSRNCGA